MTRLSMTFVLMVAVAACGGGKKPAATTTPTNETARTEPAATETKPADNKVDSTGEPGGEGTAMALDQAALATQYDAGKKVYSAKDCDSCHGDHGEGNPKNPPVIGDKALPEQPPKGARLRKAPFKTAKDVLDFIKAKMPIKQPNTLTDEEAAAVTAWILSESKVNIEKPLDATNAASIKLH